jgi:hypothetical protein
LKNSIENIWDWFQASWQFLVFLYKYKKRAILKTFAINEKKQRGLSAKDRAAKNFQNAVRDMFRNYPQTDLTPGSAIG